MPQELSQILVDRKDTILVQIEEYVANAMRKILVKLISLFGVVFLVQVLGIVWWAAVTDTKVNNNTEAIMRIVSRMEEIDKTRNERYATILAAITAARADINNLTQQVQRLQTVMDNMMDRR